MIRPVAASSLRSPSEDPTGSHGNRKHSAREAIQRRRAADGVWRRNAGKIEPVKQGGLSGTQDGVHSRDNEAKSRPGRSQSVHSSAEAG